MYSAKLTYERIVLLSQEKNIKIGQINEMCSINKDTLAASAKSKEGMKARNIYNISECLDCSTDYLLGLTDNPNSYKDQSQNTVNGNYNAVDNSSVTINSPQLTEQQKALLEIYNKLSPIQQAQLLIEADKITKN